MNSREIIKLNLAIKNPPRIGFRFGENRLDDFVVSNIGPSKNWTRSKWQDGNFEYYSDEWGNVWRKVLNMSEKGEIFEPALKNWSDLKKYQLPDLAEPSRYQQSRELFAHDNEHYRLAMMPGFVFSICRYLRKMEFYLQDLVLEKENIEELHEKVSSLLSSVIDQFAVAGADGIFFAEDWGTQHNLLISPDMWRMIFKPHYKTLCKKAHDKGLDILMHSCGYNWEILDDLAEVGVNAFQFDQPELYGIENLSQKLRKIKVCLFSPVDIQRILPLGNREQIETTAGKMVELFGNKNGGFIATGYGDLKGIGVDPKWDQWAYEAFKRHGTRTCCLPGIDT